jgi:hypothetical protein
LGYHQDNFLASQTKLHCEGSLHHGTIITHAVLNLQDASEALLPRRYIGQLSKRPDYGHSVQLVVLETLGLYPFQGFWPRDRQLFKTRQRLVCTELDLRNLRSRHRDQKTIAVARLTGQLALRLSLGCFAHDIAPLVRLTILTISRKRREPGIQLHPRAPIVGCIAVLARLWLLSNYSFVFFVRVNPEPNDFIAIEDAVSAAALHRSCAAHGSVQA